MMKTGKRINSKRQFSEEFRRKLVEDFEKGLMSVCQMERHYGVSNGLIYRWIYKYSTYNEKNIRIVEMKDSRTHKIKELERAVGQKQIKIDFLEKMIDLAQDTYSIDIKKNSITPPFGGSNPTGKE